MQGKSHAILRAIGASLFTAAMVMLSPVVSHAAEPGTHHQEHRHHGNDHQHHDHFSVPEPSANVLLLLGLGVTGLLSYGVQRRKRGA
jgi:PEP-CTERM motif